MFEDEKYWISNEIKANDIKKFKGILQDNSATVWIPPTKKMKKKILLKEKVLRMILTERYWNL